MDILENINIILSSAIGDRWNKADNMDKVDKALTHYSLDNRSKYELISVYNEARKRYPNSEALNIYRGMNFRTKEDYVNFISTLGNDRTKIKLDRISSWTTNYNTAMQFSITKPTYMEFMTKSDMDYIASGKDDYLIGYRGVIIKSHIKSGDGLDMSEFNNSGEDEIILPANIILNAEIEELIPFSESTKDKDFNEILLSITKESLKTYKGEKLFKYILNRHKPEELSDKARKHIEELYPVTFSPCFCKIDNESFSIKKRATIVTPPLHNGYKIFKYYSKNFQNKIIKYILPSLDTAVKEAYELLDKAEKPIDVKIEYLMDDKFKNIPEIESILNKYRKVIKKKYDAMNDRNYLKTIKTKEDMDNYIENIKNLLQSV